MLIARVAVAIVLLGPAPAAGHRSGSFEVVSIKRSGETSSPFRAMRFQGGRWTAVRITARELIQEAYAPEGMKVDGRVVGGPTWLDREQFDIVATATPDSSPEQVARMIKDMLAQRFALAFHTESKEFRTIELVLANDKYQLGRQLRRADCGGTGSAEVQGRPAQAPQAVSPTCSIAVVFGPPNRLVARAAPMAALASRLTMLLAQPVFDRTTLSGAFDFDLVYSPDDAPAATADRADTSSAGSAPELQTALREQLGLRMVPRRELLDVMVVDRIERPSEN